MAGASGLAAPGLGLMAKITVSVEVAAPPAAVWEELAALERHSEWMADAERIVLATDQKRGVGTRMEVMTRVGPFRTVDVMVVDLWEEGTAIGVSHRGVFTGKGTFRIEVAGTGTRVVWVEDIRFPWYLGGGISALAAAPFLRWIWRRNLGRLAARLS